MVDLGKFLFFVTMILVNLSLRAQSGNGSREKDFELINVGSGINNFPIQLNILYQDSKGFLWIGSDFGVYRFDGKQVEIIRDNSETIMSIHGFLEIGKDSMLIASDYGLGVCANGVINKIVIDSTERVSVVLKHSSKILIGTNRGLYEWTGISAKLLPGTGKWNISSALSTPGGELLVYSDTGIYSLSSAGIRLKVKPSTQEGGLFITSGQSVYYTDTVLHTLSGEPLSGNRQFEDVTSICEAKGRIFIVDAGEILYKSKVDPGWTIQDVKSDMAGTVQIFPDRYGTIWVLNHFGLTVLQEKSLHFSSSSGGQVFFQHFRDSLTRTVLLEKGDADLLVKEDGRSYLLWDKFRPEDDPGSIPANILTGLLFTKQKDCYVSFARGEKYYYCSGNKAVPVQFSERLLVSGIVQDEKQGDVWIQTTAGPARAKGASVILFSAKNGYNLRKRINITKILPDPIGNWIWVGGDKSVLGFFDLKSGKYTYMDSVWGIDPLHTGNLWIADIDSDPEGNIWFFIQNRGLYQVKRNGNNPAAFTCQLWDPNAPLGKYMFDGEGNLWVITIDVKARIYKADKQRLLEGPSIYKEINLNKDLKEGQMLSMGAFRFNSGFSPGEFSLISLQNIYTFNTRNLFPEISKENIPLLTSVLINRKKVLPLNGRFRFDLSGMPVGPVLNYDENKVGFNFSAIYSGLNNMVLFRYKLEGYEQDWQPIDKKGFIEYTNLTNGQYRFLLECSYDGKHWSPPVTYDFRIKAPWWATYWFKGPLIILFVGLAVWIYRRRIHQLRRKAAHLESLVRNRTLQLEEAMKNLEMRTDQHAMLLRVIAHDIKGPVRFIAEVSENLFLKWSELEENEKKEFGQEIKRSTRTLYSFLSDFLVWLNLRPENRLDIADVNVKQVLESVIKFHTESGNNRDNQLFFFIKGDENALQLRTNRKYLEIILNNLVDNACKHTKNGEIRLVANAENDNVIFSCIDSGSGMNPETIRQLEMLKDSATSVSGSGTGLGYRFVYSMASIIHAKVVITSEPGKGCQVDVILPKHDQL